MEKRKRKTITITLLLLILLLGIISVTTAYIIRESEDITNRFTYADADTGMDAILTEPEWDDEGEELAGNLIPGITIPKDPTITNVGAISDIWVAARVTFVYNTGHERAGQPLSQADYVKLMDVLEIDWNEDSWERIEEEVPSLVFYYRYPLEKAADENSIGDATEPLFTEVKVKGSAGNEEMEALSNMYGFCIYVEGFAAQYQSGDTYDSFKDFGVSGGVYFEHTPDADNPADLSQGK